METIARVVCCLLLAVSSCESYQTDPPQLFLNSPTHCGKVYNVTNTSVYHVSKTNVKRSFSPCDLIFTSIDPTDRVCLFKRELNLITCNSVKITLYHGHVGVDSPREYTLDCRVSLSGAEWCSRRRPSLSLSMAADGPYPSMRDVDVDLLVYSKQSVHRHVSMDTDHVCGDEFDLQRSRINVTNIDPLHSKTKSTNSRPKKTCEIMFRYEGAKNNTFLCVEFHSVRAANPLCTTPNYTLQILINRANNTKVS
ncbi:uncharacterized protein [Littorina saxatilis]|uniref:Uncharacterized protein n=1 Tax=Littorina saxatilis TaxID=31220 RepID=A0AAN9BJY2_9CAEN